MSNTKYKNIINTPFDELSKSNQKKVLRDSSGKVFGWVFDNVVSEEDCKSIIDSGKKTIRPSRTMDRKALDYRTSFNTFLQGHYITQSAKNLISLISELTKYPTENFELIQVVHYDSGQYYKPHHDYFPVDASYYDTQIKERGGQRVWTAFLYLNNVENGGETFFPIVDFKVKPRTGRIVLWKNMIDGKINPDSLHESLPPVDCEKWGANIWIREKSLSEVQEG